MAVTYLGSSFSVASGTGDITPAFYNGYSVTADDIAITFVETTSVAVGVPTGWNTLGASTVSSGTLTKLNAIWRRIQVGDTAPTITDASDHKIGRMAIFRGCRTSGDPFDQLTTTPDTVSSTTVTFPSITTTLADCMVVTGYSTGQDTSTTAATSWSAAGLTSKVEIVDAWTNLGGGGGLSVHVGAMVSPGDTGDITATFTVTANPKAQMSFVLLPPSAAASTPATRRSQMGAYLQM